MIDVYSKNQCPNCDILKRLLKEKQVEFSEFNIESDNVKREFLLGLGFRSVPQVFKDGHHIGGLKEMRELYDTK